MSSEATGHVSQRLPCADVYLTQTSVTVELEAPGFDPDELAVSVSDRDVTVSGHRSERVGGRRYLQHERGLTDFRRDFHLPDEADATHLTVRIADGVVVLRAPRGEQAGRAPVEIAPRVARVRPDYAVI
jgi:HSP20 family protein